jgi:hypothetical protein
MDANVPYMPSAKNLHAILDKIQDAGVPDSFNIDFLKDLGFTSSNDRSVIRLFKYIGFLDSSSRPQKSYREFVDHTKAKTILAQRLLDAYDDLFVSDKNSHTKTVQQLKGWFKTKTGASNSVAEKIATTFKSLAKYADFSKAKATKTAETPGESDEQPPEDESDKGQTLPPPPPSTGMSLVYRLEIHLPDTQNVETFRAIFRAMREELSV